MADGDEPRRAHDAAAGAPRRRRRAARGGVGVVARRPRRHRRRHGARGASPAPGSGSPSPAGSRSRSIFRWPASRRSTRSRRPRRARSRSSTRAAARCSSPGRSRCARRTSPSPPGALCVGDGARRYRDLLEERGADVPPDDSELHVPRASLHASLAPPSARPTRSLPVYVRAPDAERWVGGMTASRCAGWSSPTSTRSRRSSAPRTRRRGRARCSRASWRSRARSRSRRSTRTGRSSATSCSPATSTPGT